MWEIQKRDLPYERKSTAKGTRACKKYAEMGEYMKCELITEKAGESSPSTRWAAFHRFLPRAARAVDQVRRSSCSRLAARTGRATRTTTRCSASTELRSSRPRNSKRPQAARGSQEARPSQAGPGAGSVQHSGARRAGADLLPSQGRHHPQELEDWMRDQYLKRGYSLVYTPHIARADLWKTSGHYNFYAENMFKRMELDDAEYQLKPMNCPFHILIYRDRQRSLSRAARAAGRTRHGVSVRAVRRDARAAARARIHAGRRAYFLHAGADRGRESSTACSSRSIP